MKLSGNFENHMHTVLRSYVTQRKKSFCLRAFCSLNTQTAALLSIYEVDVLNVIALLGTLYFPLAF